MISLTRDQILVGHLPTLPDRFLWPCEGTQEGAAQECELRKPDLELRLQAENIKAITEYRKAVEDYPKNVCCSCQVHQRKNVTVVKFDNHLGTAVWPLLKQFMLQKLQVRCTSCVGIAKI